MCYSDFIHIFALLWYLPIAWLVFIIVVICKNTIFIDTISNSYVEVSFSLGIYMLNPVSFYNFSTSEEANIDITETLGQNKNNLRLAL